MEENTLNTIYAHVIVSALLLIVCMFIMFFVPAQTTFAVGLISFVAGYWIQNPMQQQK
jgi:hypothetical protein